MKLLILHVSEHRDEHIVRPIWDRVFEDGGNFHSPNLHQLTVYFSFGKGRRCTDARRPHHRERCPARKAFLPLRKRISAT